MKVVERRRGESVAQEELMLHFLNMQEDARVTVEGTSDERMTARRLARQVANLTSNPRKVRPCDSTTFGVSETNLENQLIERRDVARFLNLAHDSPERAVAVSNAIIAAHPEVLRGGEGVLTALIRAQEVLFRASDQLTGTKLAEKARLNPAAKFVSGVTSQWGPKFVEAALRQEDSITSLILISIGKEASAAQERKVTRMIAAMMQFSAEGTVADTISLLFSRVSDAPFSREDHSTVKSVVHAIISDPKRLDETVSKLQAVNEWAWADALRICGVEAAVQSAPSIETVSGLCSGSIKPDDPIQGADYQTLRGCLTSKSASARGGIEKVYYHTLKAGVNRQLRKLEEPAF